MSEEDIQVRFFPFCKCEAGNLVNMPESWAWALVTIVYYFKNPISLAARKDGDSNSVRRKLSTQGCKAQHSLYKHYGTGHPLCALI